MFKILLLITLNAVLVDGATYEVTAVFLATVNLLNVAVLMLDYFIHFCVVWKAFIGQDS